MSNETKVLYNGACPICSAEINHYVRYSRRNALPIRFDDLNSEARAEWGIDRDAAAKRLHVMQDGVIYVGVPAFVVLWRQMPRYRWLARLVSVPGVHWMACKVYDHILAPLLYAWNRRNGRTSVADL